MSIEFSSNLLPVSGSQEIFGFAQATKAPTSYINVGERIPRCKKCKSPEFPLKDSTFSCPICNPSDDFLDSSIRFDEGFEETNLLFFIFDATFSFEKAKEMITNFADSMKDDNRAVIIAASGNEQIIIYSSNNVPYLLKIQKTETFVPDEAYEVTKEDIINTIIPALNVLYRALLFNANGENNVDLVMPLHLVLLQQKDDKRPFGIFFMINRESKPLTREKADVIGKAIAAKYGIVHFGANEGFRRLIAIAHHSFGCVFGLSQLNPLMFSKLMILSKPTMLNIVFPRFIEVVKITSCQGEMKLTSLITSLNLTNACGCSAKLSIDYSRISDMFKENVNIVEYLDSVDGRFLTLHRFKWAETEESFINNLNQIVNQAIILKEFSSNVLRSMWDGESQKYIDHIISSNIMNIPKSCLTDIGKKPERDSLKLYYVLSSNLSNYENKLIKLPNEKGYLYVYQPVVFVYVNGNPIEEVNEIIKSDWPFDIQIFKDMDAFHFVTESYGEKIE